MLNSQGMGFALLARLPAVYGLYSSIFPGWLYYLFGTSRHLSVGAMALTALMVGAVVDRLVPGDAARRVFVTLPHRCNKRSNKKLEENVKNVTEIKKIRL